MRKTLILTALLSAVSLSFAGTTSGGDAGFTALCGVLSRIEGVAPVVIKALAMIIGLAGIISGGWMVIDRERNMMGRGFLVIGLGIVLFALLWVFADPVKDLVVSMETALKCSSTQ